MLKRRTLAGDPLAHLSLPSSPSRFEIYIEKQDSYRVYKAEHCKAKKVQLCSYLCNFNSSYPMYVF